MQVLGGMNGARLYLKSFVAGAFVHRSWRSAVCRPSKLRMRSLGGPKAYNFGLLILLAGFHRSEGLR